MKIQRRFSGRLGLTVGLLGLALALPGITPGYAAQYTDLSAVDWLAVLNSDPALRRPVDEEPFGPDKLPYINAPDDVQGYAAYKDVRLGDISGDGVAEALVPLKSGGTAGDTGLLIYAEGKNGAPVFVTALGGYKMAGNAEDGRLVVQQPVYAGWEPNCCPSGLETVRYRLRGARLQPLSAEVAGFPEARGATLAEFFDRINSKKFREAYAFMTPALQRRNPFARWQAGYTKTTEITIENATDSADASIFAVVSANDSGKRARYLFETRMTWSTRDRQWQIADLRARMIDLNAAVIAGKLGYPSSGTPPMLIVAREAGGAVITADTGVNQGAYWMIVPPGTYTVMAYPQDTPSGSTLAGGYTLAVSCGLDATCTDHVLSLVKAVAGQTVATVDLTDWYAPEGYLPGKP